MFHETSTSTVACVSVATKKKVFTKTLPSNGRFNWLTILTFRRHVAIYLIQAYLFLVFHWTMKNISSKIYKSEWDIWIRSYINVFIPLVRNFITPDVSVSISTAPSRDSAVGIATGYRLDDWEVEVPVLVGSGIFTSPCCPPNLLYNGYRGPFHGSTVAGAWSWPLTSN
jgi:hypothetical protein